MTSEQHRRLDLTSDLKKNYNLLAQYGPHPVSRNGRTSAPVFGPASIHLDYRGCKSPQPNHGRVLGLHYANPPPYNTQTGGRRLFLKIAYGDWTHASQTQI